LPEQSGGKGLTQNRATQTPPAGLLILALRPQTRGLVSVPSVILPSDAGPVEFRLALESDDFLRYRASLRDNASDQIIWRSESLRSQPGEGGRAVSVIVPGSLFKPRNYTLELHGNSRGDAFEFVASYVFRVRQE
jgi:hypothetical protein